MTIEEKRRELFEAVARKQGYDLIRYGSSDYEFSETRRAWSFFNAALDAVVIELPYAAWSGDMGDQVMVADNVRSAIESTGLGLKVKP